MLPLVVIFKWMREFCLLSSYLGAFLKYCLLWTDYLKILFQSVLESPLHIITGKSTAEFFFPRIVTGLSTGAVCFFGIGCIFALDAVRFIWVSSISVLMHYTASNCIKPKVNFKLYCCWEILQIYDDCFFLDLLSIYTN